MNYTLYQLEFQNGVRFGSGNLDSTEITFHMFLLRAPVLKQLFQVRLRKKKLEENILFFAMKKHSSWG